MLDSTAPDWLSGTAAQTQAQLRVSWISNSCSELNCAFMESHKNTGPILYSKMRSMSGTYEAEDQCPRTQQRLRKRLGYLSLAQEPKMQRPHFLHFCLCPNRMSTSEDIRQA